MINTQAAQLGSYFSVNDEFEQKYEVSEQVYELFLKAFNDQNQLHVNEQFAESKGFLNKVMHGNILNGFVSHFVGMCLPTDQVMLLSQSIQYKKPVFLHDKLKLKAKVIYVSESVNMVEMKISFFNQKEEKVAIGKFEIKGL